MAKPKLQQIKTSLLELNTGQVEGLPQNPRFIRDERYKKLKQSIEDAPEMLDMRSLIVVEHGDKYVTICGNMRLRACLELGYKELPCYVLPATTPAVKLREYTIKDNIGYGENEWDVLANEWDTAELEDWGMDLEALGVEKWGQLGYIDGDFDGPSLDKTIKIVVEISQEEADKEQEIRKAIQEAISAYDATLK